MENKSFDAAKFLKISGLLTVVAGIGLLIFDRYYGVSSELTDVLPLLGYMLIFVGFSEFLVVAPILKKAMDKENQNDQ